MQQKPLEAVVCCYLCLCSYRHACQDARSSSGISATEGLEGPHCATLATTSDYCLEWTKGRICKNKEIPLENVKKQKCD